MEVVALEDPDIQGVVVYLSDFKRSLADKLSKDFFSEPSQASISCAVVAPPTFDPTKISTPEGKEIFSEAKGFSLSNKTTRYDRSRRCHAPRLAEPARIPCRCGVAGCAASLTRRTAQPCTWPTRRG